MRTVIIHEFNWIELLGSQGLFRSVFFVHISLGKFRALAAEAHFALFRLDMKFGLLVDLRLDLQFGRGRLKVVGRFSLLRRLFRTERRSI